ncbi:hypothetical protein RD110_19430 [Rhodoferax koreense]|uniref:DUF4383 domain-containing protein n=1 Tax=Rhodoferax koreensis TaxID=1842727 RepID=A0A1P8JZD6_9BURK|nr:DUF4383 domain-containing protein [Rhodoferax koreense]APW39114.1 hypothetical protein RD110_19430 [Rhodoferax koreense]
MNATTSYVDQEHPPNRHSPASAFALGVGVLLLATGLWGLANPSVFGIFTINLPQSLVHIVMGLYGIAVGLGREPAGYLLLLGAMLLGVGLLHFVPMAAGVLSTLLKVNLPVAVFDIVVGALALLLRVFERQR